MDIKDLFENNYIDMNAIWDSILDGVVIANPSRTFLFWNNAAKKILEDEPDNVDANEWAVRYRLYDPVTEEYLAFEKLPMIMALNGEEYQDYRVMTKNANHPNGIILSVNGKPLRSGNATIGGITTFRDITKQIDQEKTIKSEKQFYERILDLMPGLVFMKDLEGKFVYGNKSFHELVGDKSVIGKSSDDYLVKSMADKVYAHDQMVLKSRSPQDFEEIIHWKDGTKSTFLTTRFPYSQENGFIKGICAVAKDITQEIQINATLEQERNRSAQVSKLAAIGVLSAEIAHEIKNPLTILQMATDVLHDAISEKEIDLKLVREKLKVFTDTIARMNNVASSLGVLSRDASLEKDSTFSVRELLESIKSLCSFKTRKLKMEISIEDSESMDLNITSNQVQISEVLLNLVMNALDAVENEVNPVVRINASKLRGFLVFKVWDNGNGVPEAIRDKIFEPFFTTKGHLKGTGLGLSISKKIAEKYNGDIFYEDTQAGHSFVFQIPLN